MLTHFNDLMYSTELDPLVDLLVASVHDIYISICSSVLLTNMIRSK